MEERKTMSIAAAEPRSLVAFTLPGTAYSVRMARFYVRAALRHHGLGDYAENAQPITSELVTNAIAHTGADAVGLELILLEGSEAIAIVVTDPCPLPPVMNGPADIEHGRGLLLVAALSASWGWKPQDPGKAVYAMLTRKGLRRA
jgi:anti-sigma regulatory factor (Ser/Thr protein kinase)